LFVNAWPISKDPASWDDPDEFQPDRFQEGEDVDFNRTHFELFPFGAGRGMCQSRRSAATVVLLSDGFIIDK
jgi:4-hydroxyphenylacetaldehyde oxime monooxygenase